MKLNYFTKKLSTVGRWLATTVFCVSAIAFVWQGGFFANTSAMAAPSLSLIASADAGDRIQDKASEDAGRAKNFIRDAADKVEETANKNARRVEQASDNNGSFVERKAKRDRDRIERRAEEDAARTQKAVDNTKNVVQRAVDNVKDAFSK
jgi:vacuolar-type H+-ATPase subunit H